MIEKLRDPKWVAIGFAAIVVCGATIKLVFHGDENTEQGRPAHATTAIVPELGRYELETTSWRKDSGSKRESAVQEVAKPVSRRNERRWSGLCIAIQRN